MIRSRLLWCAVDPRGRLMVDTLSNTRTEVISNACHDAYAKLGQRCWDLYDLTELGYRVIRVRIDEARLAAKAAANNAEEAVAQLDTERYMTDVLRRRVDEARHDRDALAALLCEVWNSIPATYEPGDPMVERHAAALNAVGRWVAAEDRKAQSEPQHPHASHE